MWQACHQHIVEHGQGLLAGPLLRGRGPFAKLSEPQQTAAQSDLCRGQTHSANKIQQTGPKRHKHDRHIQQTPRAHSANSQAAVTNRNATLRKQLT